MTQAERETIFVQLFEENRAGIRRLCYGYLNSASEVDDLFQEIMTNVWNALPSFRGDARITTWLYRIAVNTAIIHRRKHRPVEALRVVADARASAEQDLEQREELELLHRAIAQLDDRNRLIVSLLLEGISYKEIADITGISVNYVGVKIVRIKQELEQFMAEAYHGAA